MDLLVSLNRDQGITVIMVTHEPDMAEYASRIVRFVDGRVDSDLKSEQIKCVLCDLSNFPGCSNLIKF